MIQFTSHFCRFYFLSDYFSSGSYCTVIDVNIIVLSGIYYGTDARRLLENAKAKSKSSTTNLTTHSLEGLGSCESYSFVVCIIGPRGTGPASKVCVLNLFARYILTILISRPLAYRGY